MKAIFVDTSGLFAALVRNDDLHPLARPTLAALLDGSVELHATSYVLLETLALLRARVGLTAARRFEHEMRPLIRVTWIGEPLHARAFQRLELRSERDLSLVDCSTFVAMEDKGIYSVFCYDSDFGAEGFSIIGSTQSVEELIAE